MKNVSLYIPNIVEPVAGYEAINVETEMALQTIPDGSCDEIMMIDLLDILDLQTRQNVITVAASKLAYNGTIILNGLDILMIASNLLSQNITIEQINQQIYNGKKSIMSAETSVSILKSLGLKIIQKRLNDNTYSIIAQRIPQP